LQTRDLLKILVFWMGFAICPSLPFWPIRWANTACNTGRNWGPSSSWKHPSPSQPGFLSLAT